MAIFSFLDPVLNFVFNPLLLMPPFVAILLVATLISILIVVIYKYTTNQVLMKDLKDQIKAFQKQMKELKEEPKKVMEIQKKAMQTNMKYMMHSMKPTLITFIPIILIFGWLNAHFAFMPINPGQEFAMNIAFEKDISGNISVKVPEGITIIGEQTKTVEDGMVIFTFKGDAKEYDSSPIEFEVNGNSYVKELIISNQKEYKPPVKRIKDGTIKSITTSNGKTIVLNLFGLRLGWLATYLILAISFSMLLRKLLKVY